MNLAIACVKHFKALVWKILFFVLGPGWGRYSESTMQVKNRVTGTTLLK
jgi:hypothetical protein